MHAYLSRALVGACTILVLASCGSDNGSTGISPEKAFPANMVETFGSTGQTLADYTDAAINFDGPNVLLAPGMAPGAAISLRSLEHVLSLAGNDPTLAARAIAAVHSAGCVPAQVGIGTDTDADGIPDDATITYSAANCTVTDTATGDVNVTRGVIHIVDTNDDLYGFAVTITGLRLDTYDGSSHDWLREFVDSKETAKTTTTGGTWTLNLSVDAMQGSADTIKLTQTVTYNVKGVLTSNGAIPAGGPIPNSTMVLSGTLDATLPTSGRLVMDLVTTNAPHYSSSCGDVDTGTLEMRLNGSTSEGVLVKWIGCDSAAWEFLGSGTL